MGEQFDASRPIYAQLVERLKARILAKREYLNPAGSVKDRIARARIRYVIWPQPPG